MDRVLGIDGGGTKTEAIAVDRTGQVVLHRRAPGTDPTGADGWEATLTGLAASLGPAAQAVLGLPFHGEIAAISRRQGEVARAAFGPGGHVLNDVAVAFEGAFAGAHGVLVLAGTGSMAWARGPQGTHRVGGWGDAFGDEGSAFWIGRKALQRASQELDGRRPDRGFARALLQALGIAPDDLIGWTYGLALPRRDLAGIAEHVSALARAGLADAAELMADAGQELAGQAETAARLSGAGRVWSHAGGVMADPVVRDILQARIGAPPVPPVLPPVGGAALLAARAAGWETGPPFLARLRQTLAAAGRGHQA